MYKKVGIVGVLLSLIFFSLLERTCLSQETITITTYYPAPAGVYRDLTIARCLRFEDTGTDNKDVDVCSDDSDYNTVSGITLRILQNPSSGEPIFRVLSIGIIEVVFSGFKMVV
jgi:hypothetical protein